MIEVILGVSRRSPLTIRSVMPLTALACGLIGTAGSRRPQ